MVGVKAARPRVFYCVDCRVEFDIADARRHAVCEVSTQLPSVRRAMAVANRRPPPVIRHDSGFPGVNRVFGGGLARGSCSLLTGLAGVGKSTLLIQILMAVALAGGVVVYVSGEESVAQVTDRAAAMGPVPPNLKIVSTQSWEKALPVIRQLRPQLVVVDSIQRIATIRPGEAGRGGRPGSHTQVVAMAGAIVHLCKHMEDGWNPVVIAVGHLNAEGEAAGPEAARHDLDAHFHMSLGSSNEIYLASRKNRFGQRGVVATFRFQGKRLVELPDLSAMLLDGALGEAGAVPFPAAHLAQVIVAPIEAVVSPQVDPKEAPPRVWQAKGSLSNHALRDLLDLLRTHHGPDCSARDVRVNVPRVADVDINDPTLEAAVLCAVISSAEQRVPTRGIAYLGSFTLTGKLRPPDRLWDQVEACLAQGIRCVVGPPLPPAGGPPPIPRGVKYVGVPDLSGLIAEFRQLNPVRLEPVRRMAPQAPTEPDPFTAEPPNPPEPSPGLGVDETDPA